MRQRRRPRRRFGCNGISSCPDRCWLLLLNVTGPGPRPGTTCEESSQTWSLATQGCPGFERDSRRQGGGCARRMPGELSELTEGL